MVGTDKTHLATLRVGSGGAASARRAGRSALASARGRAGALTVADGGRSGLESTRSASGLSSGSANSRHGSCCESR